MVCAHSFCNRIPKILHLEKKNLKKAITTFEIDFRGKQKAVREGTA